MRQVIKILAPSIVVAAMLLISAGAPRSMAAVSKDNNFVWAMVTDTAGLGDKGFNDSTYAGLQKAKKDFGGQVKVVQSTEQAQYVPNLTELAQAHVSLIVGVGFLLTDSVTQVAKQFPDTKFAVIDTAAQGNNVASYVFNQNEGSYLGGIMAGMMTKTNKVGFIGGIAIPPVVSWWAGYAAGVKTVNPRAKVLTTYVGSFTDPAKGKEAALAQFNAGADIIFEASGQSGLGVWSAAKARGTKVHVFGTDTCKYKLSPKNALPDILKRVDIASYDAAKSVVKGNFKAGTFTLGLKNNGIGLCQKTLGRVPLKVRNLMNKATLLIDRRSIKVPNDAASVKSFKAPKSLKP